MTTNNALKLQIPLFIKLASIILTLFFCYATVAMFGGIEKINYAYGLGAHKSALIDTIIVLIFIAKVTLTYGYLTGKFWSIRYGILDAVIGIIIYIIATAIPFIAYDQATPNQRVMGLDILLLIPYLYALLNFNLRQKLLKR